MGDLAMEFENLDGLFSDKVCAMANVCVQPSTIWPSEQPMGQPSRLSMEPWNFQNEAFFLISYVLFIFHHQLRSDFGYRCCCCCCSDELLRITKTVNQY